MSDGAPPAADEAAIAGRPTGARVICPYHEVRAAAKDPATFSSDLQGDPDVRDYRQLPLEVDPPAHGAYRALLLPFFGRVEVAAMEPGFRAAARDVVRRFAQAGRADAVHDLAFEMVLRSLAVAVRRDADLDEWRRWGIETWVTRPDGTRDGTHLDRYLDRVYAEAQPDPAGDVFARLAAARLDGRPLEAGEFRGLASLVLAGGRDTVIKLLAGATWHLASHPRDRDALAADPSRLPTAIEEWLRWISPLPRMRRVARREARTDAGPVAPGDDVVLDFLAANHDPAVFDAPHELRLDRAPNRHVAFGQGPHTCVGAHLAKVEARIFLEELLAAAPRLALDGEPEIGWEFVHGARVANVFRRVPVRTG
ncbi:MAG: cytochrome P450 [Gemmatimonadota bacterium]